MNGTAEKGQSIEEKINYRMVLMGIVSLVLTAVICVAFFHRAFREQIWHDLSAECRQAAAVYAHVQDTTVLTDFAGELRVTLISPDGGVLFESATTQTMENHLTRPEIQQALAEGTGQSVRQSATLNYNTYYYAQVLSNGTILRVAREAGNLYAIYDQAIPAVLFSCLLILMVSVGLSMPLTRQLVRPILNMADHLDRLEDSAPYRELQPFIEALVTDRRLRESNAQIRQDFTANVSHELKTPLTSISGYAELIGTGLARPEDVPGFAKKINTEAKRMLRLVGDIIQLTELDTLSAQPEQRPAMAPVDLREIAKNCADSLALAAKNAFLTIEVEGLHTMVRGEANLLEELCYNLCDNAIRYNKPGGRVTITTGSLNSVPYLRVADNGIGIPQDSVNRVFERFYRVDKSRSKATGGTGLGLAIVKHVAQIHSARIRLESVLGEGTVVTVLFDGKE